VSATAVGTESALGRYLNDLALRDSIKALNDCVEALVETGEHYQPVLPAAAELIRGLADNAARLGLGAVEAWPAPPADL
jgi:hypothetical protein